MPFSIIALDAGVTRIVLEGDLDVVTVEGLRPELVGVVRRCPTQLEMDLSHLRSVDTRGMQVLVAFFASLARINCRITVTGMRDQLPKRFKAALFDAILHEPQLAN
ncbi:MAG TPA: STAS domain-containing protein [Polyangia bacterium]|jgi:anti-anti-sigma factor|nr:STAS domain-containing protein [Polyangia bacterium]